MLPFSFFFCKQDNFCNWHFWRNIVKYSDYFCSTSREAQINHSYFIVHLTVKLLPVKLASLHSLHILKLLFMINVLIVIYVMFDNTTVVIVSNSKVEFLWQLQTSRVIQWNVSYLVYALNLSLWMLLSQIIYWTRVKCCIIYSPLKCC